MLVDGLDHRLGVVGCKANDSVLRPGVREMRLAGLSVRSRSFFRS